MRYSNMAETSKQSNSVLARYGKVVVFCFLILLKKMGVPPRLFRREKVRRVMESWTIPMMWLYIKSRGTRIYMDQPCTFKMGDIKPKCDVDPRFKFSDAEMESFYRNGFIGPLTAMSQGEM